jgi:hypothetical protein
LNKIYQLKTTQKAALRLMGKLLKLRTSPGRTNSNGTEEERGMAPEYDFEMIDMVYAHDSCVRGSRDSLEQCGNSDDEQGALRGVESIDRHRFICLMGGMAICVDQIDKRQDTGTAPVTVIRERELTRGRAGLPVKLMIASRTKTS